MARDIVRRHPGRLTVALLFEPRDWWIGLYVGKSWWEMGRRYREVYICLLPCLPILIAWHNKGNWED